MGVRVRLGILIFGAHSCFTRYLNFLEQEFGISFAGAHGILERYRAWQETSSDENKYTEKPLRKNHFRALVFDCGTSETKGILVEYDRDLGVVLRDTDGMKVSFVDFAAADSPFPEKQFLKQPPNEDIIGYVGFNVLFRR